MYFWQAKREGWIYIFFWMSDLKYELLISADSWPQVLDDNNARQDWGWQHEYNLTAMTTAVLEALAPKYSTWTVQVRPKQLHNSEKAKVGLTTNDTTTLVVKLQYIIIASHNSQAVYPPYICLLFSGFSNVYHFACVCMDYSSETLLYY